MLNIKAKHVVNKIVWNEKIPIGEMHKEENENVTIIEFFLDPAGTPNFVYVGEDAHFYTDNIKYFHFDDGRRQEKPPTSE